MKKVSWTLMFNVPDNAKINNQCPLKNSVQCFSNHTLIVNFQHPISYLKMSIDKGNKDNCKTILMYFICKTKIDLDKTFSQNS